MQSNFEFDKDPAPQDGVNLPREVCPSFASFPMLLLFQFNKAEEPKATTPGNA